MFDETTITAKSYKEKYYELRLNEYLAKYIDYDDLTFIENELGFFNNCFQSSIVELRENYGDPYDHNSRITYYYEVLDDTDGFVSNPKIFQALLLPNGECYEKNHPTNGYDLEKSNRFKITFGKIIEFLQELQHYKTIENIKQSSILSEFIKKDPELTNTTEVVTNESNTKETAHTLFNGKRLNIAERYTIANKIFGFEKTFKTLNISDDEKYQILSYVLNCNKDNARHVMNGTYKAKERDLSIYLTSLNLNK